MSEKGGTAAAACAFTLLPPPPTAAASDNRRSRLFSPPPPPPPNHHKKNLARRAQETFSAERKLHTLDRLAWSDMFETFLANKYTAAKRFGLEARALRWPLSRRARLRRLGAGWAWQRGGRGRCRSFALSLPRCSAPRRPLP